ncbi:MAG: glycine cleavage system protein R [Gammaproteobacteria bacterium]
MKKTLHLAMTVIGDHSPALPEQLTKTVSDCGCHIKDCRMTVLGQQLAVLMLLSGNWDSIAKVEDALLKEKDLAIHIKRTECDNPGGKLIPYAVDVICPDQAGVHSKLMQFFAKNNTHIHDLYSTTYEASQTATTMVSVHLNIHVPVDIAISSLRNDFMDFCDRLNLDAIMEPIK